MTIKGATDRGMLHDERVIRDVYRQKAMLVTMIIGKHIQEKQVADDQS